MKIFNDFLCRNAAIWSLPKETRADVYEKATKLQRKFIYLPLYIFQKETNISQLVQKLLKERKYNEAMIRTIMKRQVFQAHKNLAEVKSWPPFLSDLKFLGEDSSDDEIILLPDESTGQGQPIASTSGSQGQSLLISGSSRKRKVNWRENQSFFCINYFHQSFLFAGKFMSKQRKRFGAR